MPRKSSSRTGKKSSVRASSRTSGSGKKSRSSSARESSTRSLADRKVLVMPRRHDAGLAAEHPPAGGTSAQSHPLTDHEEIRRWAEERDAHPACVRATGGREDAGMIRLGFPGFSGDRLLEEIEWDQWFEQFDENRLALLVQEQTTGGQRSNFNKLVKRETAKKKSSGRRTGRGRGAA